MATQEKAPDARQIGPALTLDQVRVILSDEVERLRAGESAPAQANAITNAVGKILSSVKLEMEYMRLTGRKVDVPMLNRGSDEKVS